MVSYLDSAYTLEMRAQDEFDRLSLTDVLQERSSVETKIVDRIVSSWKASCSSLWCSKFSPLSPFGLVPHLFKKRVKSAVHKALDTLSTRTNPDYKTDLYFDNALERAKCEVILKKAVTDPQQIEQLKTRIEKIVSG